ncbi:hypothetical protein ACFPME_15750 [Rhodanobacter umsongensis]|uniref:Uncharacterized protein n=1 Tax=Rhodanobacter umsongensis TaxID=633153 RepID=A0ABW0JQI3_9GAMM
MPRLSRHRTLLPVLQAIVALAAICWFGEAGRYGFAGLPGKADLRVMDGVYIGPGGDSLIEIAVNQRGETWHRLFTLYPRAAPRARLLRGEQMNLLVNGAGVIMQIESAVSTIHWSYEQEWRRHRQVMDLSGLTGTLALLGCGLLYLTRHEE